MKKQFLFYSLAFILSQTSFPLGSLGEITTQSIFSRTSWPRLKDEVNRKLNTEGEGFRGCFKFNHSKLKKLDFSKMNLQNIEFNNHKIIKCNFKGCDLENVIFTNVILKEIDFSKMNLKNVKFIDCQLINVKFINSDLRKVDFGESVFEKVDLHNALLYNGFTFDRNKSHENLIRQYSNLITKYKKEKQKNSDLANIFYAKSQALNKVLGSLKIKLKGGTLKNLDLSEINLGRARIESVSLEKTDFTNANLKYAFITECDLIDTVLINTNLENTIFLDSNFIKVIFSEKIQLSEDDLYFHNQNEDTIEKKSFKEKLLHTLCLFNYDPSENHTWDHKDLHRVNLSRVDFLGADLSYSDLRWSNLPEDLQGTNFTGAKIEGTKLSADFRGAILTDTELKGPRLLWECKLQEVWLSDTVQIPDYPEDNLTKVFDMWNNGTDEEKPLCQKLLACGFSFFRGVSNEKLKQVNWQEKNLVNVNLGNAELQNVDLSYTNLTNAYLFNANLQKTNLEGCNLKRAWLVQADLTGANLKNANLKNAGLSNKLQYADFTGANLKNISFINALLQGTNFKDAKLKGTDFSGAKLSDYYTLPANCTDDLLINCYYECNDQEAKALLEQIILGKKLLPKSCFETENTEEINESLNKKMRIEYLIN